MRSQMFSLGILVALAGVGCRDDDPRAAGQEARLTYLVGEDADRLTFLMGRQGIADHLPRILEGDKVGEKWTLVRVNRVLVADPERAADIDLAQSGVDVAHEFSADDPYTDGHDARWFRLDFATEASSTSGRLTFDRSGEAARLDLEVEFEGMSDVYEGTSPTHIKFTILTGFPIAPSSTEVP